MRKLILLLLLLLLGSLTVQAQGDAFSRQVLALRGDLERLTDAVLQPGNRPDGWTFNVNNVASPTFITDLWYDNELLATAIFGESRPDTWIGAPTSPNPAIIARNVRHDLELSADERAQAPNQRPEGWVGGFALFRCDRTVMNLYVLMSNEYRLTFTTPETTISYCVIVSAEIQDLLLQVERLYNNGESREQIKDLTLAVRGDLERLADERRGLNVRPDGWRRNTDRESTTLASDVFLDMELLADDLLGPGVRPPGYVGSIPNNPVFAAYTLRADLERLANAAGQIIRPRGWQGTDPVGACAPLDQAMVRVVTDLYEYTVPQIPADAGFCRALNSSINTLAENPPPPPEESAPDAFFSAESQWAFVYLDVAATQYMGQMPGGTRFRAWYRNFNESNMMFVSGDDFAVFIDRRWTNLDPEVFARLPTLEGVKPLTFCDATWCNGPGPTPTPTGSGPIELLLLEGTAIPTPDRGQVATTKTQINWNSIRVTYIVDDTASRTAQVTLELCADNTQVDCEPAQSVFDNSAGAPKQVIGQAANGLNIYQFPYGYSDNLLIEGATRFSADVWISDPTLR
jgi:hypothetical protein